MNLPVIRTGSSRADFVGVDPRQPSPTPMDPHGRRLSELTATEKLVLDWTKELNTFKGTKIYGEDEPASILLEGASGLSKNVHICSEYPSPEAKKESLCILLPFLVVPVEITTDITLEYLKMQIFARLKKTPISEYTWEPSDYVFKCIHKDTGEMEVYYHEDLRIWKLPYSKISPALFLYPREGQHAEKELSKQLSAVLGYSLEALENSFNEEHRDCRAKFWLAAEEVKKERLVTGSKYVTFPEEIYWPPAVEELSTSLATKIAGRKLRYEIFYWTRENEKIGNDKEFSFAEVAFDPQLTPDSLIQRALAEMKANGHKVDLKEKYVLQLAGKRSFLSGSKRLVINYMKIRSSFENYKSPKFVLRRLDLVLQQTPSESPMVKPHYVKVEESRIESERHGEQITSIWNIDEQIYIQPCSFSIFEANRDPNATVVCVFTFYVGNAMICQYASDEASLKNPRWVKNPIYTDFYIKDIPESLSLCIQLYEVIRKERPKKKVSKKEKSLADDQSERTSQYSLEFPDRESLYQSSASLLLENYPKDREQKVQSQVYKGWPEFFDLIKECQNEEEEKRPIKCLGWYHVPLFNWQKTLQFGTYTYSLWKGEPELGKSNMSESKGDKKSNCRLTIDVYLSQSSRQYHSPRICQAVDDSKWAELCPLNQDKDIFNKDKERSDMMMQEIFAAYRRRIKDGYFEMTEELGNNLWEQRYVWAQTCPDALLLLVENKTMWVTRDRFGEIYQMILKSAFKALSLQTCIAILASSNGDRIIRAFAVHCTDKLLEDRNMPLYILPLVQALKTEPRVYSDLSCMLLRRSLKNWKIGHKVFWLLRSELMLLRDTVGPENKLFKKIAILVEAILRGNESRLPSFAKQVAMVEYMNKLTISIRSLGSRELANKKLKEELRDPDPSLENLDSPLDTSAYLGELVIDQCKVLGSAKSPLKLTWKNPLPFAEYFLTTHEIIFKHGDDLRQDMLVLQMIEVMEECWTNAGIDCSLSIYPVLPTGKMIGMIGVVPNSKTIFQIQSEDGKKGTAVKQSLGSSFLYSYIRKYTKGNDFMDSVERFTMSCVGYSVGMYLMGIKDRHNDNIMVSRDGKLFHIDFGHILGHAKKKLGIQRDRVPFVMVEPFMCVIAKIGKNETVLSDSKEILRFRKNCEQAYRHIWKYRYLFVAIFTVMKQMELPELSTERDLDHVKHTMQLNTEDENLAAATFDRAFDEAIKGSWATMANWFFHTVKHL